MRREDVAESILKEIKNRVKSINDIISFPELPFCYSDQKSDYIKTFGEERFNRYMDAINLCTEVRDHVRGVVKDDRVLFSTDVLINLSTALCGVGECGEQSMLGFCKLLEKNCPGKINWISISGKENKDDNHCIILISLMKVKLTSLKDFKSLDDNCLLVDPLFGIIGKANKIHLLLKDIVEQYKLDPIEQHIEFSVELHKNWFIVLLKKSIDISEKIKKDLNLEKRIADIYNPSSLTASSLVEVKQTAVQKVLSKELKPELAFQPPLGSQSGRQKGGMCKIFFEFFQTSNKPDTIKARDARILKARHTFRVR